MKARGCFLTRTLQIEPKIFLPDNQGATHLGMLVPPYHTAQPETRNTQPETRNPDTPFILKTIPPSLRDTFVIKILCILHFSY